MNTLTPNVVRGLLVSVLLLAGLARLTAAPSLSVGPDHLTSATASGAAAWAFSSTPVAFGSGSAMVTAAPEFVVIRLPSALASGAVISLGRLVPTQLVISGSSEPRIIPLMREEPGTLWQGAWRAWQEAEVSEASPEKTGEPRSASSPSAREALARVGRFLFEAPEAREMRLWVILGLAVASVCWSVLLSHQTHQAARAMLGFPWSALLHGMAAVCVAGLIVMAGRHSPGVLVLLACAGMPLLPVAFLVPAVTAAGIGHRLPGGVLDGRGRPWMHFLLVLICWGVVFLPTLGPFVFALLSIWGLGGLMLAGVSPVRESENSSSEVVS